MADPIVIEITDAIDPTIAVSINTIAEAAAKCDVTITALKENLASFSVGQQVAAGQAAFAELDGAISGTLQRIADLNVTLDLTSEAGLNLASAMTDATLEVTDLAVAADLSTAAIIDLGAAGELLTAAFVGVGAAAVTATSEATAGVERTNAAVRETSGNLGILGKLFIGAFAVEAIAHEEDVLNKLNNTLKLAGLSGQEFIDEQKTLFDIANENAQSIDSVSNLYRRFSQDAKELGASQGQINTAIDGVTAALRLQGTSTATNSRVLNDLSEAVNGGTVSMRQFRQILTQTPQVLQEIANGIESTSGSTEKLIKLVQDKKLTGAELFSGLVNGAKQAQEEADKMQVSISGSLVILNNNFLAFLNSTQPAAAAVADVIVLLSNNLDTVIPVVLLFGATLVVDQLVSFSDSLTRMSEALIVLAGRFVVGSIAALQFTIANAGLILEIIAFTAVTLAAAAATLVLMGKWDEAVAHWTALKDQFVSAASNILPTLNHAVQDAGNSFTDFATKQDAGTEATDKATKTTKEHTAAVRLDSEALAEQKLRLDPLASALKAIGVSTTGMTPAQEKLNAQIEKSNQLLAAFSPYATTAATSANAFGTAANTNVGKVNTLTNSVKLLTIALADYQHAATGTDTYANDPYAIKTPGQFDDITGNFSDNAFAEGGSFMVGGRPGTDTNRVSFWASSDERVDVLTPEQQASRGRGSSGGTTIKIHAPITIVANDPNQFRNSSDQLGRHVSDVIASASAA